MMEFEKRCWAEVDLDKIEHNFKVIQQHAPNSKIMAVVKADAYGHGDAVVVTTLEAAGASRFAVSGFAEALQLLTDFYADPAKADAAATVAAIGAHLEQVAWHHMNVAQSATPELEF